jgi:hypothetical protein
MTAVSRSGAGTEANLSSVSRAKGKSAEFCGFAKIGLLAIRIKTCAVRSLNGSVFSIGSHCP